MSWDLFQPAGGDVRRLTRQELQRAREAVATLGVILGRSETPKRRRRCRTAHPAIAAESLPVGPKKYWD